MRTFGNSFTTCVTSRTSTTESPQTAGSTSAPQQRTASPVVLQNLTHSPRLCMGAAWREVRDGLDFDRVVETVEALDRLRPSVANRLEVVSVHPEIVA